MRTYPSLFLTSISLPFEPCEHKPSKADAKDGQDEYDVNISVSLIVVLRSMCLPFRSVERSMWLLSYGLKFEIEVQNIPLFDVLLPVIAR